MAVVLASAAQQRAGEEIYVPPEQEERARLSALLAQLPAVPRTGGDLDSATAFGEAVAALEHRCAEREEYADAELLRTLRLAFAPRETGVGSAESPEALQQQLLEQGFACLANAVPAGLLGCIQRACPTTAVETTTPLPCLHLDPAFIECLSLPGEDPLS